MLKHLRGAVVVEAVDQKVACATGHKFDGPILAHVIVGHGPEQIIIARSDGAPLLLTDADIHPTDRTLVFADCRGYGRSAKLISTGADDEWLRDAQRLASWLEWQSFRIVTDSEMLMRLPLQASPVAHSASRARAVKSVHYADLAVPTVTIGE
jgi:hypothetical protein